MLLPVLLILFSVAETILGKTVDSIEVSYEELLNLNVSCYPRDSCQERVDDTPGVAYRYSCSCNKHCSKVGTCCVDSPYRNYSSSIPMPSCRTPGMISFRRTGYFMVDKCTNDGGKNFTLKTLCEEEWNEEDDLMKLVPVTSLHTSATYKNYYCFRCHEITEDFVYWNVQLQGYNSDERLAVKDVSVKYNKTKGTWMAVFQEYGVSIPVTLEYLSTDDISPILIKCDPRILNRCPDEWTDRITRDKCNAYTAIITVRSGGKSQMYKNPHCALCNIKYLDEFSCVSLSFTALRRGEYFTFIHLLDLNRPKEDRMAKIVKCGKDFLWDPYGKRCRKLSCALDGYVLKDGQCVPPESSD